MKNKILMITALFAAMTLMTGIVEAATETIKLTNTNTGETGYEVTVITDTMTNQMSLRLTDVPQGCDPSLGNSGIDQVTYNSKITTGANEIGWNFKGNGQYQGDGFGKFSSDNQNSASTSGIASDLVFTIPNWMFR